MLNTTEDSSSWHAVTAPPWASATIPLAPSLPIPDNSTATVWVIVDDGGAVGNDSAQITDDHTLPASAVTDPSDGASPSTVDSVVGTATDTGGSTVATVEVSIYDGSNYYETGSGNFTSAAEVWITATGTTSWSLDTSLVPWQAGSSYTVRSRATDAVGNVETAGTGNTFSFTESRPRLLPKKSKGGCSLSESTSQSSASAWLFPFILLFPALLILRRRSRRTNQLP